MSFKGGNFINRYRIEGTLITESPLHIGDGGRASNPERFPKPKVQESKGQEADSQKTKVNEPPEFTTVIKDTNQRAYIPGSTLKGSIRSWVTQIFEALGLAVINDKKRADSLANSLNDCIKRKVELSELGQTLKTAEFLFGSSINEGKLEFWDAPMQSPPVLPANEILSHAGYDQQSGTILFKSVAINPKTGTAEDKKLYNYEAVPKGASFGLTVCGQNLEDLELGMLLFALEGFNSVIYPLTLGAMESIGYGHFKFKLDRVLCLDETNLDDWLSSALQTGHAGYHGLKTLDETERNALIAGAKADFQKKITKTEG